VIIIGGAILIWGLTHFYFSFNPNLVKNYFLELQQSNISPILLGVIFTLLGTALLLPITKAIHRFHFVHLCVLVLLSLSTIVILGFLYRQIVSPHFYAINMPLGLAIVLFMSCVEFSLRWPARGFIGLFTTDSSSGTFAMRMLLTTVVMVSVVGLVTLLGVEQGIYSIHEAMAVGAVLLIILFTAITWINTKLLYKMELERFIFREELRIHNIDLKLGNKELAEKMKGLEQANREFSIKLNERNKYFEAIENVE
jgi:uncharacterized membrane protein YhdT